MKTWNLRSAVPAALAASMLMLVACGDDDPSTAAAGEQAVTAETAIAEVDETRKGLAGALATYESGDEASAGDEASEVYLQHFELVEGPLEEVDAELTEELEDQIREELIGAMKAGDPVSDVSKLVDQIDSDLADATDKLQAG